MIIIFIYLTVLTTPPSSINVDFSSTQATVTWSAVTGGSPGEEVTEYNLCMSTEGHDEVMSLWYQLYSQLYIGGI